MSTFKIGEASPAHLALARRQGKRAEWRDGEYVVVAYEWQGDVYVTEVRPLADPPGTPE